MRSVNKLHADIVLLRDELRVSPNAPSFCDIFVGFVLKAKTLPIDLQRNAPKATQGGACRD